VTADRERAFARCVITDYLALDYATSGNRLVPSALQLAGHEGSPSVDIVLPDGAIP